MKRAFRHLTILVPLVALAAAPLLADVKTHDRTSVKFYGFLGRMMGMFGGKAAKAPSPSRVIARPPSTTPPAASSICRRKRSTTST
jgi:hypothetical protein